MRLLNAKNEISLAAAATALLPRLLRLGLAPEDALALAHNAALLYYALDLADGGGKPMDVLEHYSLAEIARLCARYAAKKARYEMYAHANDGEGEEST